MAEINPSFSSNSLMKESFIIKLGICNKFAFTRDNRPVYRSFVCPNLPTDDSLWYDKLFFEMRKHAVQLCYLGRGKPAHVSDLRQDDYLVSFFYYDIDDDMVIFDTAKELGRIIIFASEIGLRKIKVKADVYTKPDRILGKNNAIDSTTQLCCDMHRQMLSLGLLSSSKTATNNKGTATLSVDVSSTDEYGFPQVVVAQTALQKLKKLMKQKDIQTKQLSSSPTRNGDTRPKDSNNSFQNEPIGADPDSLGLFYVIDSFGSSTTAPFTNTSKDQPHNSTDSKTVKDKSPPKGLLGVGAALRFPPPPRSSNNRKISSTSPNLNIINDPVANTSKNKSWVAETKSPERTDSNKLTQTHRCTAANVNTNLSETKEVTSRFKLTDNREPSNIISTSSCGDSEEDDVDIWRRDEETKNSISSLSCIKEDDNFSTRVQCEIPTAASI